MYEVEIQDVMTCIHDNEVNNISKCNLMHDIPNRLKRTKQLNIHESPIIHVCIRNFESYWIVDVFP